MLEDLSGMELEDWLKWKGIEETSTPVSLAKDRMIISAENEQGQRKALKGVMTYLYAGRTVKEK